MKVKGQPEFFQIQRDRLPKTSSMDPKVEIELKGAKYQLEYNNFAALNILKDCEFNLLTGTISEVQMGDPAILGSFIHRGLETNHPDLKREDVDKLITIRHHPYITNRVMEAMRAFLPVMDDVEIEKPSETKEQETP